VRAVALLLLVSATAAAEEPQIVDKPITYDDERIRLTKAYRKAHTDDGVDGVEIQPKMIVLHYTAGTSFKGSWRYFDRIHADTGRKKLKKAGNVNVSAHFLIDRDGTIYRLVKETWMARHTIGLNHVAIGIENVGDGKKHKLTAAQVAANIALIHYLASKYPITHMIGHSEYRRMEGHAYFREKDPKYRNRKGDPGDDFLTKVRAGIADLGLEGAPE